jgi:hypothetical protein
MRDPLDSRAPCGLTLVMDAQKHADLRQSLERMLHEEAGSRDPHGRLLWLTEQLERHVQRFLGFAEVSKASPPALLRSDLFAVIGIVSEVLDSELSRTRPPAAISASWGAFRTTLAETANCTDSSPLPNLRLALETWQASFDETSW